MRWTRILGIASLMIMGSVGSLFVMGCAGGAVASDTSADSGASDPTATPNKADESLDPEELSKKFAKTCKDLEDYYNTPIEWHVFIDGSRSYNVDPEKTAKRVGAFLRKLPIEGQDMVCPELFDRSVHPMFTGSAAFLNGRLLADWAQDRDGGPAVLPQVLDALSAEHRSEGSELTNLAAVLSFIRSEPVCEESDGRGSAAACACKPTKHKAAIGTLRHVDIVLTDGQNDPDRGQDTPDSSGGPVKDPLGSARSPLGELFNWRDPIGRPEGIWLIVDVEGFHWAKKSPIIAAWDSERERICGTLDKGEETNDSQVEADQDGVWVGPNISVWRMAPEIGRTMQRMRRFHGRGTGAYPCFAQGAGERWPVGGCYLPGTPLPFPTTVTGLGFPPSVHVDWPSKWAEDRGSDTLDWSGGTSVPVEVPTDVMDGYSSTLELTYGFLARGTYDEGLRVSVRSKGHSQVGDSHRERLQRLATPLSRWQTQTIPVSINSDMEVRKRFSLPWEVEAFVESSSEKRFVGFWLGQSRSTRDSSEAALSRFYRAAEPAGELSAVLAIVCWFLALGASGWATRESNSAISIDLYTRGRKFLDKKYGSSLVCYRVHKRRVEFEIISYNNGQKSIDGSIEEKEPTVGVPPAKDVFTIDLVVAWGVVFVMIHYPGNNNRTTGTWERDPLNGVVEGLVGAVYRPIGWWWVNWKLQSNWMKFRYFFPSSMTNHRDGGECVCLEVGCEFSPRGKFWALVRFASLVFASLAVGAAFAGTWWALFGTSAPGCWGSTAIVSWGASLVAAACWALLNWIKGLIGRFWNPYGASEPTVNTNSRRVFGYAWLLRSLSECGQVILPMMLTCAAMVVFVGGDLTQKLWILLVGMLAVVGLLIGSDWLRMWVVKKRVRAKKDLGGLDLILEAVLGRFSVGI